MEQKADSKKKPVESILRVLNSEKINNEKML